MKDQTLTKQDRCILGSLFGFVVGILIGHLLTIIIVVNVPLGQ